jgi:hypothetical protein
MKKSKLVLRGFLGYVPGLLGMLKETRDRSGTVSARYCYSVWLRHLLLLNKAGYTQIPESVAELGPGASLGVGLAALLSGVQNYYAFDIIKHTEVAMNKKIFHELLELFENKEPVPAQDEFPSLKPLLKNYEFPAHLLPDEWLKKTLDKKRLAKITTSIDNLYYENPQSMIKYTVPWNDESRIQQEYVDLIISQAVMEHVLPLEKTYYAMFLWLKKGGYISHQIDFKAHETSPVWYGHRLYSDWLWRIIMKGRSYAINREPYLVHQKIIEKYFKICYEEKTTDSIPWEMVKLNNKFSHYEKADLSVANAFVIARKQD